MKKASVSINVIILFVIGLLVLIVVVALVVQNINRGDEQLGACSGAPGIQARCLSECPLGQRYVMGDSECQRNQQQEICCIIG